MIEAEKARELVEASDTFINKVLERISPRIEQAARAGQRELFLYEDELWDSYETFVAVTPTPRQVRVCDALHEHGYRANVVMH